jgi:hypothetical protein
MKKIVMMALLFAIGLISWQTEHSNLTNLNTFHVIPGDMQGAGESFYLSTKDKKEGKFICTTDYETALIYINQKPMRLKVKTTSDLSRNKQLFSYEGYALTIVEESLKKAGDENYTFKGILTLKCNSNVVWEKAIIGEGGD